MEGDASHNTLCLSAIQFDELPINDILALVDGFVTNTGTQNALDQPNDASVPPTVMLPPQSKPVKGRKPSGLKPKRVRREQTEALYLRQQAEHLEKTLTALSIKNRMRLQDPVRRGPVGALNTAVEAAMWKQIASRNLKLRIASETENKCLKAKVQELVQFADNLAQKTDATKRRNSLFSLSSDWAALSSQTSSSSVCTIDHVGKEFSKNHSLPGTLEGFVHGLKSMQQAILNREQRSIIAVENMAITTDTTTRIGGKRSSARESAQTLLKRTASASENTQIIEFLHAQTQMADQVKQILCRTNVKEVLLTLEQLARRPPALGAIDVKKQIALLDSLYFETETVFLSSAFAESSTPSFNTVHVNKDSKVGLMVEIRSRHIVNYDLDTTMAAQWQLARASQANGHFIYEEAKEISRNLLSREFGFQTQLKSREAHFRGRHTTKKFNSDEGNVYVWHTRVVPLDATSGSSACIFPLITKGRTAIRRARNSSPTCPSTVIESYCQIIPELEDITRADLEQHREGINALLAFSKRVTERNADAIAELLDAAKMKSQGLAMDDDTARRFLAAG